jgi:hypothetical protein
MKDFQKWHHLKSELDKKEHGAFINEREICFVSIGENIGFEQNGKMKCSNDQSLFSKNLELRRLSVYLLRVNLANEDFILPFIMVTKSRQLYSLRYDFSIQEES